MQRRVVVTGLGMVSPLGTDVESSWAGLVAGKSGAVSMAEETADLPGLGCTIAAPCPLQDTSAFVDEIGPSVRVDRLAQFALFAAQEAMSSAGLGSKIDDEAARRAGCIMGVGLGGYDAVLMGVHTLREKGVSAVETSVLEGLLSHNAASVIACRHHLQGPVYATVSACTSGAHGVGEAFLHVREGRADIMVCGGAEAGVNKVTLSGFAAMRALSRRNDDPKAASRPFEKNRDGFVLAEGAGVLVLEEYEHAKARGATIYAELLGYGASGDAHHITAPAEEGEGAQRSMRAAIDMSGLAPTDIQYINAHGTSTAMNDVNEAIAIRKVFGDAWTDGGLMVSSTKSMTGHALGGAGGLESVISVLVLSRQVVPPTINYDEPDPEIVLDVVPNVAREAKVDAVLSNAFGFGGTNGTLLFALPR